MDRLTLGYNVYTAVGFLEGINVARKLELPHRSAVYASLSSAKALPNIYQDLPPLDKKHTLVLSFIRKRCTYLSTSK